MIWVLRVWDPWCWSHDKRAGRDFWGWCKNVEITRAIGRWTRVNFYKIGYGDTLKTTTDISEKNRIVGSLKAVRSELEQWVVERTGELEHANQRLTNFTDIESGWL